MPEVRVDCNLLNRKRRYVQPGDLVCLSGEMFYKFNRTGNGTKLLNLHNLKNGNLLCPFRELNISKGDSIKYAKKTNSSNK